MSHVDRRTLLWAIAAGVVAAISRAPSSGAVPITWKVPEGRIPPPAGVLARLPGDGNQLALTVDDGVSVPVVGAFAQFCRDTGTRLTFFVNGAKDQIALTDVNRALADRVRAAGVDTDFVEIPNGEHGTAWYAALAQMFDFFAARHCSSKSGTRP